MRTKNKILSGILALSAIACVSLGIAFQSNDGITASAVSGMSVNTLGYLEWTAETGVTSYEVTSSRDGETYGTVTTTEAKVNVGDAIMRAVNSATAENPDATETSVTFTVTPYTDGVAGTPSEYTHPITSYIDYAFNKTDFSDATTTAGAQVGTEGSISITGNTKTVGVGNAMTKNELFTFTWQTSAKLSTSEDQNTWIYLFGKDGCDWSSTSHSYYVWAMQLYRTGAILYANGAENSAKNAPDTRVKISTIITPTFNTGIDHKFSVGVFDTYGLDGEKVGETVYVRLDDATNGKLEDEGYYFASNDSLTTYGINESGSDEYKGRSGFGICSPSTNFTYTVTAGNTYDTAYGESLYEAAGLSLSTNGDIGVNLYVNNLSEIANANLAGAKVQLTYKGEMQEIALPAAETAGAMAGAHKISFAVAPKDINEKITARVVIAGGPMGKAVQYSVADYINSVAEGSEQYAIVQALKNYCDTAVSYFNAEAEQPALDETVVDLSQYAPTFVSSDENVTPYGISLIVEEKTTIRFFFKLTGEMPAILVDGKSVEAVADGTAGFYYVDLADISAKDLDKDFEFQVGDCKVKCCALTYGLSVLGIESDNKTVNLVKALYAYNQAANNYFGE